ncbi:MAG: hypothetical protein HFH32_12425, partial [Eubacterium sp.]|nr:hypothetical protein [Eubacterium sp.]
MEGTLEDNQKNSHGSQQGESGSREENQWTAQHQAAGRHRTGKQHQAA